VFNGADDSRKIKSFNDFIENSEFIDISIWGRKFMWYMLG